MPHRLENIITPELREEYPNASDQELFFLAEVKLGRLTVDELGRIWRHFSYYGKNGRWLQKPKRAEYHALNGYLVLKKHGMYLGEITFYYARAHRVVYMVMHGDIPIGLEMNHKNAIRHDNQPANLEVVTHAENMSHAKAMGLTRSLEGEANRNSKLTRQNVLAIRRLRNERGLSYQKIADRFNVSKRNIICITKRLTWRHI